MAESEFVGMEKLIMTFNKLSVSLEREAVSPGMDKAAEIMVNAMKSRARRSTKHLHHAAEYGHRPGFLCDSIMSKKLKNQSAISILVGYDRDAYYARFLEQGTSKMGKKPFIRPAFQKSKDEAEQAAIVIIQSNMDRAIEDAKK